jgi:DNA-binding NtrC family response regulator
LNVVPLRAPPLRERADDVPRLSATFIELASRENGMKVKSISDEAVALLAAYPWPGNVRELRNVIERLVILSDESIGVDDLPEEILAEVARTRREATAPPTELPRVELPAEARALPLREFRDHMEREYIRIKLDENGWNISRTASLLGIERTNLHKKMRALGLSRDNQGQPAS